MVGVCEQKHGVDYFDTFAAVVKALTYRILFCLVALNDWECEHVYLETAFLNSWLLEEEEFFVQRPVGFEKNQLTTLHSSVTYSALYMA